MDLNELRKRVALAPTVEGKALVRADYQGPGPTLVSGDVSQRRMSNGASARHLQAYAGGDEAIDWVGDCAWLIAETAASSAYHYEKGGEVYTAGESYADNQKDAKKGPDDLTALVENPNPWMCWDELIELTVLDYLLAGNCYWLKYKTDDTGKPLAIYRLNPGDIEILPTRKGTIGTYVYKVAGAEPVNFKPEKIIHFKRPNPNNPYFGAGVIASGPRTFDLELYLTESQTQYYENGTRLSGVLESDKNVGPSGFEKIKSTFKQLYSGRNKAHNVAVLERGLSFKPIQGTSAESGYRLASEFSRDRIAAAFRVPVSLLGSRAANTSSTAPREDQRIFDNKTMRPLLNKLQGELSRSLTQAWGLDFVFEYEYVLPKEDQLTLAGTIGALPGIRVNEVREAAGYPPLEGKDAESGDVVLNLPGENDNASDVKDPPLPGEAGRPPKRENTAAIEAGKQPTDAEARSN